MFYGFLFVLRPSAVRQSPRWMVLSAVSLVLAFWIGQTSEFIMHLRGKESELLRATRRHRRSLAEERQRSERLLLNILPETIADELKSTDRVAPVRFQSASVLFTDFQGFTRIAEEMPPEELVAGVIGEKKFSYNVWGDTVNTASRAESAGEVGRINITEATYTLVQDYFECERRGTVAVKNKEPIAMYFVHRIRPELSRDSDGQVPNDEFRARYHRLSAAVISGE